MRRLFIGLFLLFAITVQAQERRIEDWMVWLYVPDSGTLLFKGFYADQGDTVTYVPVSFERHLQIPDNAADFPASVVVSDDASSLAYAISNKAQDNSNTVDRFATVVVSEVLSQGYSVHEVHTFLAGAMSIVFHSTAEIQELGHILYHKQQRLPALASQYPDRERTIAYAYKGVGGTWRIEVYDANNEKVLYQFDQEKIPELNADRIIVHRYLDDTIRFSAITAGKEQLYDWSVTDSTIRELPIYLLSAQRSDYLESTNEALQTEGNSLLYYKNPDASGSEIFTGDASEELLFPRFIQSGERIVLAQSRTSLTLLERDGTVLMSDYEVPNLTQIVGVPTGFVYVVETDTYSTVTYYHTEDNDFSSQGLPMWGNFNTASHVEVIYVHHG